MNKKDKKFISALIFLQTGVVLAIISISGKFWHDQNEVCKSIKNLSELRDSIYNTIDRVESEKKINSFKNKYEHEGIGVKE